MMLLSLASFRHFDLYLIAAKVIDDGRWKEILSKGANCLRKISQSSETFRHFSSSKSQSQAVP
eukprot:scaffold2957_cov232-Chaetoceros_neogracile.AAC.7